MDGTTLLLFALLIGCFAAYVWHQQRTIQDANSKAWATASEPFIVMSRHHMDTSVSSEAAHIREQLKVHGNQYLKNPQTGGYEDAVFEEVYSAAATTTSRNFQVWLDITLIDVQKKREAFREQKRQWNQDAAKQQFGGQTVYTQTNAN